MHLHEGIRLDKFQYHYYQSLLLRSLTSGLEASTEIIEEHTTKDQNKIFKSENIHLYFIKENPFKSDGYQILQVSYSSNYLSS